MRRFILDLDLGGSRWLVGFNEHLQKPREGGASLSSGEMKEGWDERFIDPGARKNTRSPKHTYNSSYKKSVE